MFVLPNWLLGFVVIVLTTLTVASLDGPTICDSSFERLLDLNLWLHSSICGMLPQKSRFRFDGKKEEAQHITGLVPRALQFRNEMINIWVRQRHDVIKLYIDFFNVIPCAMLKKSNLQVHVCTGWIVHVAGVFKQPEEWSPLLGWCLLKMVTYSHILKKEMTRRISFYNKNNSWKKLTLNILIY